MLTIDPADFDYEQFTEDIEHSMLKLSFKELEFISEIARKLDGQAPVLCHWLSDCVFAIQMQREMVSQEMPEPPWPHCSLSDAAEGAMVLAFILEDRWTPSVRDVLIKVQRTLHGAQLEWAREVERTNCEEYFGKPIPRRKANEC